MTYAIAAAGTGGHVFPGLAVAEALIARGVGRDDILFIGGDRLESRVYPEAGYPFLEVELAGLARHLTVANLRIPVVVGRAVIRITRELRERRTRVLLGMGGYVTVPAGLAARRAGARLLLAEQNAEAGLANRMMAPMAVKVFGSFRTTSGIAKAEWSGNPVRGFLTRLDRQTLRPEARRRYSLGETGAVIGVMGGSLGAGVLNQAVAAVARAGLDCSLLHLTGAEHATTTMAEAVGSPTPWRVVGFEDRMDLFYAAIDCVVARAGGGVAEFTATATPSVLVPGGFGSSGHQRANAAALVKEGAAVMIEEADLDVRLPAVLRSLLDGPTRGRMVEGCLRLAKPEAAATIAMVMGSTHV